MKKILITVCVLLSFSLFAGERYQMVAGKDAFMWILDTKTGEVFSCIGSNQCVYLSNINNLKKFNPRENVSLNEIVEEVKVN